MTRRGSRGAVRTVVVVAAVLVLTASTAVAAQRLLLAPMGEKGVVTLLLLGSDTGLSRGGTPLNARADAFHLLFVSPDRRHATIINVPRDSYVPVAGRGTTRINACLTSGPDGCVATVESLWGIDVDHYLLTSMSGWKEGVARLGGVRMNVRTPLYDGGPNITSTGRQRLTGGQALTYGRDRKNRSGGDFARSGAQAELLAALHRQLTDGAPSLQRVSRVLEILRSHTITDLGPAEILRYGYAAMRLPPGNVRSRTLPGSTGRAGEASVVFLGSGAGGIVADAADDGRLSSGGG